MLNRWYKILRKVEAASQLRISIGKTHSIGVCQTEVGKGDDTIGNKHCKQDSTSEGPLYVLTRRAPCRPPNDYRINCKAASRSDGDGGTPVAPYCTMAVRA